jgi:hypothetical protein
MVDDAEEYPSKGSLRSFPCPCVSSFRLSFLFGSSCAGIDGWGPEPWSRAVASAAPAIGGVSDVVVLGLLLTWDHA